MIFLLCSGRRNFIDLISNTCHPKSYRYHLGQVLTVLFFTCTTCIVYQYFKELAAFVSKAGAKVKTLFLTTKLFRKFFFNLSLYSFLRLFMRKGKNVWKKGSGLFLCESECKDKNFIYYPPKLFGSFFVLFFRTNHAFSTSQFRKAFFSWKAGAKVRPFRIPSKYIKLFFRTFFEGIS